MVTALSLTALLVAGLVPAAMGMHHQPLAHVRSRAPLPSGRLVPHASFPQPPSHLPHGTSASSASDDEPPFRMRRKKQHHQQQQQQQKTRLQQHSLRGSDVTTRHGHGHEAWLAAATLAAACSSLVLHQQHTALAVLSVATLVAVAAPSMLADVVRQVVDHLTTLQHASSVVRPSVPVPATPQAFTVYRQRPGPLIPFATAVGAPAYGVQTRSSPDNGKRPPDGAALFLYNDTLHSGGSGSSGVLSRGVGTYSSTYNGGSGGSSVLAMSAVDEEGALKAQEIQAALDESTRRFSLWWQQHTEARRRLLAGADGCGDNGTSLLAAPAQLAVGVEERENEVDNDDDDDAVAVPASVAALMEALHDHVDTLPSPLAAADGGAPLPVEGEGEWEVSWGVYRPSDDKADAVAAMAEVAEVAPTLLTHTEPDLPTAAAVATSLPTTAPAKAKAKAKAVTASLQPESWRQWGKDIDWGKMRAQGSLPLPPSSFISSSSSAPHRCAIGLHQGATFTAARRATPRRRASHASSHPHARHARCPSRRRCWHPPPPAPLPRRPRPRLPKRRPTGPCRRWGSRHCWPRQRRPPTSRPRFPNWRRPPPGGRSTARKWAWRR